MSQTSERLKYLAFQRRSKDYEEVKQLLFYLQRCGTDDSANDEAIDAAQVYIQEVEEPRKQPPIQNRRNHGALFA